ncbi:hypothetical protein Gotur_029587 [Gossypium turneri]
MKKKKKIPDGSEQISTSFTNAATLLGESIRTVGLKLSRSITFEDEHFRALSKISDHLM